MTPEDLKDYQFSYVSKEVMLLLMHSPTLDAITEIRKIIDVLTDSLIQKTLESSIGFRK